MLDQMPAVDARMDRRMFNKLVMRGLDEIGFVALHAPRLSAKLAHSYQVLAQVFDLPEAIKATYAHPELDHQRGWTPPYAEKHIACRGKGPGGSDIGDAKECWFSGPDDLLPANIWPTQVPALKGVMSWNRQEMVRLGAPVMQAISQELGKESDYLVSKTRKAPSLLRALHYLPIAADQVGKITWGCEHTDINFLTVLPASTRPGLWIRRRDGMWIPGTAPKGYVIIQIGDMLDYLTGGQLMSAAHEVRAPNHPSEGRRSMATFIHADDDVVLDPQIRGPNAALYPPITAGDLLRRRLKEIRLSAY